MCAYRPRIFTKIYESSQSHMPICYTVGYVNSVGYYFRSDCSDRDGGEYQFEIVLVNLFTGINARFSYIDNTCLKTHFFNFQILNLIKLTAHPSLNSAYSTFKCGNIAYLKMHVNIKLHLKRNLTHSVGIFLCQRSGWCDEHMSYKVCMRIHIS